MGTVKSLGLGLESYHDGKLHFPSATVPHDTLPPVQRLSWLADNFYLIDGQVLLLIDPAKAWDDTGNIEPTIEVYDEGKTKRYILGDCPLLLCPKNPARGSPGRPGVTHYVGIAGLGKDAAESPLGYPSVGLILPTVGVFGHDRKVRRKDITDGAATTMMLAETALDNGPWTAGGRPTVRGLEQNGVSYIGVGGQFGGLHRGGAVILFADGSVRFLAESVEARTFEALSTIAGREKVDLPEE
jgi:prepilin-type processing-associated H-X9-DG protein